MLLPVRWVELAVFIMVGMTRESCSRPQDVYLPRQLYFTSSKDGVPGDWPWNRMLGLLVDGLLEVWWREGEVVALATNAGYEKRH